MIQIIKSLTGKKPQEFTDLNEFNDWYLKNCKNKNEDYFEYLKKDQFTKFYLDYDAEMKKEVCIEDIKEHYSLCLEELEGLKELFKCQFPNKDINIYCATRTGNGIYIKKNGKSEKKGFKVSLRFFFNVSVQYMQIPKFLNALDIKIFDKSPYNKTQKLNMVGCTKSSYDKRVLLPFDGEKICSIDENKHCLSNFIASYTDDCIKCIFRFMEEEEQKEEDNKNKKPSISKNNVIQDDDIIFNQIKELINRCLTQERATDYTTWTHILWSIINSFRHDPKKCLYLSHLFSAKSYKYDETAVDNFINNNIYKEHLTPRTLASLYFDAKVDNEEEFKKVMHKFSLYKIDDFTHTGVARMIFKLKPDDFIWINKDLYTFNGKYWIKDPHYLRVYINGEFTQLLKDVCNTYEPKTDEWEQIVKNIKLLGYENFKNGIIQSSRDFYLRTDVKFDNKPHLFAFENCVYDLIKKEFREFRKDDYLTINSGYNYREPTDEEREHFQNIWNSIVPAQNPDLNMCLTHIYTTGMWGKTLERFVLMNGSGRNGKGLLNGMIKYVLGNYYADGNNEILTNKIKTGANPEIANLEGKRLIICREPDENVPLNNGTIKELTGSSVIKARKCNSNEDNVNFVGTLMLECNTKPPFSGDTGIAETERIIDLLLPHFFTTDKNMIDNNKVFLANPYYKTDENYEKCKYAFLEHLLKYNEKFNDYDLFNLQVPQSIRDRSIEYISSANDVAEWLTNNLEKTGNKEDVLSAKEIYDEFKIADDDDISKEAKKSANKKRIIKILRTNIKFCNDFMDRYRFYEEGKRKENKSCLVGWKMVEKENEE